MRGGAAALQQQAFEQRFVQFEELAWGQFFRNADGRLGKLARCRKAVFTINMLQQLEADVTHIQRALL